MYIFIYICTLYIHYIFIKPHSVFCFLFVAPNSKKRCLVRLVLLCVSLVPFLFLLKLATLIFCKF